MKWIDKAWIKEHGHFALVSAVVFATLIAWHLESDIQPFDTVCYVSGVVLGVGWLECYKRYPGHLVLRIAAFATLLLAVASLVRLVPQAIAGTCFLFWFIVAIRFPHLQSVGDLQVDR